MKDVIWEPRHPEKSRMWEFLCRAEKKYHQSFPTYHDLYQWSIQEPQAFWALLCDYFAIDFTTPFTEVCQTASSMLDTRWFLHATLNYAQELLLGNKEVALSHKIALIGIQENQTRVVYSYKELFTQVANLAAALQKKGVGTHTRVAAILPNTPETIIAMLATTALGAIWSACSPDFGIQATLDRLGQIEPSLLFATDGHQYAGKTHSGFEKIQALIKAIPSLQTVVMLPHLNPTLTHLPVANAILWDDFLQTADSIPFLPLPFDHPLCIVFSSGTTGKPKCIVHRAGGVLLQHVKELALHSDLSSKDNLCFYTTCGWMMWNWMVSALKLGTTLTLYEGSPTFPSADRLFQLLEAEKVTVFGTSAKFISSIEKAHVSLKKRYSLPHLRSILSTGSPLLPRNYDFIQKEIKQDLQISSISGGTDILSCFALGNPLIPVYKGELQSIGLGMAVDIYSEQGATLAVGKGELVCTRPFPSMPLCFWQDVENKAYHQAYFSRFSNIWAHGDFAEKTPHQGLIIHGRSDSVLNPGGVRIGTAEIYRQLEGIATILESVVVGQVVEGDVRIVLFVKLAPGVNLDAALIATIKNTLRTQASPRHVPAVILQVEDIPHTFNGKIAELAVKQIIHGEEVPNKDSLANPASLVYFQNRKELLCS